MLQSCKKNESVDIRVTLVQRKKKKTRGAQSKRENSPLQIRFTWRMRCYGFNMRTAIFAILFAVFYSANAALTTEDVDPSDKASRAPCTSLGKFPTVEGAGVASVSVWRDAIAVGASDEGACPSFSRFQIVYAVRLV